MVRLDTRFYVCDTELERNASWPDGVRCLCLDTNKKYVLSGGVFVHIGGGMMEISNIPIGTSAVTVCAGNDSRLSDARAPTVHSHAISDVTGLQTTLNGKAASAHTHTAADVVGTAVLASDARLTDARTPIAHLTSHLAGGSDAIKLDDLAQPDDNTDLNASTARHGLLPKFDGSTTTFLRGDGTWSIPPSSSGGNPSFTPGSFTVATGEAKIMSRRLIMTGSQRATIQGTGALRIN